MQELCAYHPCTSTGLEDLVFKRGHTFSVGTARIPLNYKLLLLLGHFELLVSRDQQARRGLPDLAGVTDDYQEEVGLRLHHGGMENCVWKHVATWAYWYSLAQW